MQHINILLYLFLLQRRASRRASLRRGSISALPQKSAEIPWDIFERLFMPFLFCHAAAIVSSHLLHALNISNISTFAVFVWFALSTVGAVLFYHFVKVSEAQIADLRPIGQRTLECHKRGGSAECHKSVADILILLTPTVDRAKPHLGRHGRVGSRPNANADSWTDWRSVRFQFRVGHNFGSCMVKASVCV